MIIHCLRYLIITIGCLHYLWTGDCGYACGYATFYDYHSGEPMRLFVPEGDCSIHDNDKWWARLVSKRKHNPAWQEYNESPSLERPPRKPPRTPDRFRDS